MFQNVVGELDFGRRAMGGSLDLGVDLGTIQVEWLRAQLCGGRAGRRATRPALRAGRQPLARRGRLAARRARCPPSGTSASGGRLTPRTARHRRRRRLVRRRPAPPVPDPRRRPRQAARLRTRTDGPDADPRSARRPRLHVGRLGPRRRGDRTGHRTPVREHERGVDRLRRQALRRAPRRPHVQRVRRHRAHDRQRHRPVDRRPVGHRDRVPCRSPHPRGRLVERLPTLRTQSRIPARIPGRPRCSSPRSSACSTTRRARPASCCP